jgi:hypothetical protein
LNKKKTTIILKKIKNKIKNDKESVAPYTINKFKKKIKISEK